MFIHARTDNLFRFTDRNAPALGAPYGLGTYPSGGGINVPTVTQSSARSRYQALTLGLRGGGGILKQSITFEAQYTLAFDRSDDANELDPFVLRYASVAHPESEYGWSDRDRRHQLSRYLMLALPGSVQLNHVFRYLSASPVSEQCANPGMRAAQPSDRICPDGAILQRNTLGRENQFFTWDLRLDRTFRLGERVYVEPLVEVFDMTNADNFLDTTLGSLLFNFDGSLRSGLGNTKRGQVDIKVRFSRHGAAREENTGAACDRLLRHPRPAGASAEGSAQYILKRHRGRSTRPRIPSMPTLRSAATCTAIGSLLRFGPFATGSAVDPNVLGWAQWHSLAGTRTILPSGKKNHAKFCLYANVPVNWNPWNAGISCSR